MNGRIPVHPPVETVEAKPLLQSKVFWFNAASLIYALASAGGWHPIPLNPEAQTYLTGLVNIILRLVTKQPVKVF